MYSYAHICKIQVPNSILNKLFESLRKCKIQPELVIHVTYTGESHELLRSDTPAPGQVVECVITACQSRRAEPVMQIEFSFHPYIMDCLELPNAMRRAPHCL